MNRWLVGLCVAALGAVYADRPNVIMIFADDLGPEMLGCYGQKIVKTPHIDRLAAEGIKFTNYYGGTFCAPSRWTLLTGMHDGRMGGWKQTQAGLPIERDAGRITEEEYRKRMEEIKASADPITPNEVMLGQIGQQAGYKTAQVGKLDRGFLTWHERVKRHGWDHYVGYYDHVRCHGYYPPYLWRNGERFELEGNPLSNCGKMSEEGNEPVGSGGKTYSQNIFIEEVLRYIRENKDHPFFLYHPTQLPHGPVAIPELHPDFADDPRLSLSEKKYASMVKMLDDHVGLIMAELKKQGLDDKTLVFFASDNGHATYYNHGNESLNTLFAKQLKPDGTKTNLTDDKWRLSEFEDVFNGAGGRAGQKRSGFQGGIQCPLIVRWPGKIKAGGATALLSAHYDFMATIADVMGVPVPKGKDSISYLPTLLGQEQRQKHDYVIVGTRMRTMGSGAVIDKDGWKVIEVGPAHKPSYQLYNILKDNNEYYNLEDQHPEKTEALANILKREIDSERPDLVAGPNP
ncbi:Arylsulfatase [Pontiella sulfatireligans]|uniref:Arylsulfatase n=2 Tax=Pontiella sulfatireligans TaxID=2750658 RepID=A0A6C2UF30_9BACT|nr:sulfatase S1_20 [Kiritimatiellales bacterium]VGO18822.1 Arylsulfatase [Pontiella sulfatireligans]